ncbi:hypothetical protein N2152v2_005347 [Parachlorella kessleri]
MSHPVFQKGCLVDAAAIDSEAGLEIGSGSGYVICSLALLLQQLGAPAQLYATDVNVEAAKATLGTLRMHSVDTVDVVLTDLVTELQPRLNGMVDLLLFNPPYVPTPDGEVGGGSISAAWAGGDRGRRVIDRVLPLVPQLLSPRGEMLMVTVHDNDPDGLGQRRQVLLPGPQLWQQPPSAHTCTLVAADGWKVVPTVGAAKDITAAILLAVEDQERTEDLAALWENHVDTEFVEKDADEAVATMVPDAAVNHMPTMTGGQGMENLRSFYATHFIPKMPEDVNLTPIDRIISNDSVVDEFVFEFTHNVTMDWMLPGVPPTGRKVRIPFVAIIKFEGDKLKAERIYWDQASVLVQVGLLNATGLPVTGVEQASRGGSSA